MSSTSVSRAVSFAVWTGIGSLPWLGSSGSSYRYTTPDASCRHLLCATAAFAASDVLDEAALLDAAKRVASGSATEAALGYERPVYEPPGSLYPAAGAFDAGDDALRRTIVEQVVTLARRDADVTDVEVNLADDEARGGHRGDDAAAGLVQDLARHALADLEQSGKVVVGELDRVIGGDRLFELGVEVDGARQQRPGRAAVSGADFEQSSVRSAQRR